MRRSRMQGLRRVVRRLRDRRAGMILLYHRVAEADTDPWGLAVSPRHFAEHLEVLQVSSRAVRLAEPADGLRDAREKPRAVAVTFDDGYADNLLTARPLLERYDVPATLFLATGYIGCDREFWWDELARLVLQPLTPPATLRLTVDGGAFEWTSRESAPSGEDAWRRFRAWRAWDRPPTDRHALYYALWQRLRPLVHGDQQRALDDLASWAGLERTVRPSYRPLTADEAAALGRGGLVEIGAHTVTHPMLSALGVASQEAEIRRSRVRCEELAGCRVTSFAYPYGDYTADTIAAVRDAGLARACSTAGCAVRRSADAFGLSRVQVQDCDGEAFSRQLARGFVDWDVWPTPPRIR